MAKTFVGSGKKKANHWLKVTLKPEILNKAHWQSYEGHEFIKLDINILEAPDKFGKDVQVTLDTWNPDKKADAPEQPSIPDKEGDSLPF